MTTEQIEDNIVDCLQDYCKHISTSRELKEFLETNFQFDGYYSIDDSYLDYYISDLYLRSEVIKQLNIGADVFINKLKDCDGGLFWKKYKDKIEPTREYTPEEEINFFFKDLNDVNYSKFSTMQGIIEYRIEEMKKCYKAKAFLSVIILAGSVLEALLVSLYRSNSELFDKSLAFIFSVIQGKKLDKNMEKAVRWLKTQCIEQTETDQHNFTSLAMIPEETESDNIHSTCASMDDIVDNFRKSLERLIWEYHRITHPKMPEYKTNDNDIGNDNFCIFFKKQKDNLNKEQFQILITLAYYIGILKNEYSFDKANELREYRNYIHPAKQNDNFNTFTADEIKAKSFISNLAVVLKDISEWKPKEKN